MRTILTALLLLGGSAVFAQTPTFEVASIKPAAPQEMGRIMMRMGGDPGMIDWKNISLRLLVQRAYSVKDFQVEAPDWMSSARFDVQAKLPPDTPQETRNLMLQQLLAERFGLKVHKETKELPVYSLVVGKNGPKLKKAEQQEPQPPAAEGPGAAGGGRGGPGGGRGAGGPGMMMMRIEGAGKFHMVANAVPMSGLVDMLAMQVGRPVYDNTALAGLYDIDMEFKPDMSAIKGMPMPMMRPEGGGEPAPDGIEAPSIFTAVQDQLGLKLESKKGPVETIVVDHAEKTPTEN